ncbi:ABC transporter ATP-binding protein [Streptomyces bluensis]|uniref:ABC transporter ATP-binding protein n=1 Tax=Streptomyces bluensis TaxID=33897 RepID=UPI001676E517|nr:ABC transporter ATP-binding protein [Streptomyces bluensis]GGZ63130.1 spermidine/putrescine import ATP-binding protein PotA [Streptomyces bluensis]
MTAAAQFIDVSRTFGDFTAVGSLNLDIPEGRITTLLGPSGCGKTTTLRMLAGYTAPSSGTIRIAGEDATRLPPEKRNLGMVFQSYALFPHMSVADNVGYGLKLRRIPAAERRSRVAEALDLVGLGHLAAQRPRKLSGGQQQRVALARAIAIRPSLLLLDEPLSNLDARLRVQMRAEIRRIQAETGLTVVLVTHDQDEALEMSDVMVLMRAGHVMQSGSPAEVFPRPANRFVAEFLGYENFVPASLSASDGATTLTVRPEHLEVVQGEAPDGARLALPATVTGIAYRGVDRHLTLSAPRGEGEDDVTLIATVRADHSRADWRPGDRVTVSARPEHVVELAD